MDVKAAELLKAVGGEALAGFDGRFSIRRVSTDTRTIEPGDAFFALSGERFDAHDFLKEAIEKGARLCVVSRAKAATAELRKLSGFVTVPDTLAAYGDFARFWRERFRIPVVAISGSAGKTTVKELVAHVLSAKFNVLKNRGTENNLVGVPKTLLQMDETHQVAVLELGTNHPGEIDRLASIVQPQIGILTQVAQSHLLGLKDLAGVKAEKLRLMAHLERGGLLLLNGQDPQLRDVQSGVHKTIRVGLAKEGNELWADQIWCHEGGSSFHVERFASEPQMERTLFEIPLLGRHNVVNALFAVAAASALGVEFADVKRALSSFRPVAGRLQTKRMDGILFLDDSYNSNPASFRAALETLRDFKIREKKIVVCGDMLELGDQAEALHREAGSWLAELRFDQVIAAGALSAHLVDEAVKRGLDAKRIHHVKDSQAAGKLAREIAGAGDVVLVKGSRGSQMEKVFECFTTSSIR